MKPDIKIAIIRPIGAPISHTFYNSQELGLARELSNNYISVDVYVAGNSSEVICQHIETSGNGSVRLFEVPFFKIPLIDHAIYPKLIGLLNSGGYSFIQVNEENELTSFLVARYAKKNGIPVVVYQGMYEQLTGRIYAAFQRCYDRYLLPYFRNNIELALVKTSSAGNHLARKGFNKIKVMPVGLDPSPFANPKGRNWRKEFDVTDDSNILLYVGVFEERRNVDFMIDLAKHLTQAGVVLMMAGIGPEFAKISARVIDEKISNVRLVGSVSQEALPSLYRESSLFLLPSTYEIYGMVVLEAMYFGVPVISTRTAGPKDIIENGINGLLIDEVNIDHWADAIRTVLSDKEILDTMAKASERKIHDHLCWDTVARDYATNIIKAFIT